MKREELKGIVKEIINEEMNKGKIDNYFTFGGYNHPLLRYNCVKIFGTPQEARDKMFQLFSDKWGFQYDKQPREREIELNKAMKLSDEFIENPEKFKDENE